VFPSASGATIEATIASTAVASQTGRKRAATAALAASAAPEAPAVPGARDGDGGVAAATAHSEQVQRTVSMMAERTPVDYWPDH
jgi:hypothetical protein